MNTLESGPVVLRQDDPRAAELLGQGWVVSHRSWGARLSISDADADALPEYERLTSRVLAVGYSLRPLVPQDAEVYVALEAANREDYPGGVATAPEEVTVPMLQERLAGEDWLIVGAWDANRQLVGATANYRETDRWEVDRTSVLASVRGQGLATAMKAWSILELYRRGVRHFGTGGACENAASLAMNQRLGFQLEPFWLTLVPPLN